MPIILPADFDSTPVLTLLSETSKGLIAFDHRLLRSLLARREETRAALARYTAEPQPEALLDLADQIFDLYRHFRVPEAVDFYIRLCKDLPDLESDDLVEAFASLGALSVEPLLKLHDSAPEDDRPDILFMLAAVGVHDERIAPLLLETLGRDPFEGALAIGLYHDPALKPAVEAALAKLDPSAAQERKALEDCLEAISMPRGPSEPEEFDIFSLYPEAAPPLFESIAPGQALEFLRCPLEDYRLHAALSFTDDDYTDEVRDALVALTRTDSSPAVRGAAFRALGERAAEHEIQSLLLQTLTGKREHKEEWLGSLVALASLSAEEPVHRAILEAYENEETRAGSLEAMWRSLDDRYSEYVEPNLSSSDPECRRNAVHGVGAFAIHRLAMHLVPLFDAPDLREEALFSYALAAPGPASKKFVHRLLDDIGEKAGGLSGSEREAVAVALDTRLERAGLTPVFFPPEKNEPVQRTSAKIGRNDPCPCGSGKKYKKCCGA